MLIFISPKMLLKNKLRTELKHFLSPSPLEIDKWYTVCTGYGITISLVKITVVISWSAQRSLALWRYVNIQIRLLRSVTKFLSQRYFELTYMNNVIIKFCFGSNIFVSEPSKF